VSLRTPTSHRPVCDLITQTPSTCCFCWGSTLTPIYNLQWYDDRQCHHHPKIITTSINHQALSAIKSIWRLLFFTVNLAERNSHLLITHVDLLRAAVRHVKQQHPFVIDAMVIMPNHLHALWTLPEGDIYRVRWGEP